MKKPNISLIFILIIKLSSSQINYDYLYPKIEESEKTQIMILGTSHLSQIDSLDLEALEPLNNMLEKWKPDVVCIEANNPKSVSQIENLIKYYYNLEIIDEAKEYLDQNRDTVMFETKDLESFIEANNQKKQQILAHLIYNKEIYTALLLWLRFNQNGQLSISNKIDNYLNSLAKNTNESVSIGVETAKRLKLDKIYNIDDNTEKNDLLTIQEELMKDLQKKVNLEEITKAEIYKESEEKLAEGLTKRNLLPYYRYLNSEHYLKKDVKTQWHLFFRSDLKSKLDRSRVSLWEVRNLRIASHIRTASYLHQGGKILVIIGVAHKPFLDSYLSKMTDVKLINLNDL